MPSSRQARMIRMAMVPRLATSNFLNIKANPPEFPRGGSQDGRLSRGSSSRLRCDGWRSRAVNAPSME
jgi:hypothetical protein